jgi:hypothetical protein
VKVRLKYSHASNKTTGTVDIPIQEIAYTTHFPIGEGIEKSVFVLKPKIDKIAIVMDVPDPEEQKGLLVNLWGYVEDAEFTQFSSAPKAAKKATRYKTNVAIGQPDSKHHVLLQADPTNKDTAFVRFEFNPTKLGLSGFAVFKDALTLAFGLDFSYGDLVKHGRVTQVDFACDLLNAEIDELILKAANPAKTHTYHGVSGKLETMYLGLKKNKSSPMLVYNKSQQLQDAKRKPKFGAVACTRVEVTVRTNQNLKKLTTLPNPFGRIYVYCPSPALAPAESHIWTLFLDSCRFRGMDAALSQLPKAERPPYKRALAAAKTVVWRPVQIWKFWPQVLAASGLSP